MTTVRGAAIAAVLTMLSGASFGVSRAKAQDRAQRSVVYEAVEHAPPNQTFAYRVVLGGRGALAFLDGFQVRESYLARAERSSRDRTELRLVRRLEGDGPALSVQAPLLVVQRGAGRSRSNSSLEFGAMAPRLPRTARRIPARLQSHVRPMDVRFPGMSPNAVAAHLAEIADVLGDCGPVAERAGEAVVTCASGIVMRHAAADYDTVHVTLETARNVPVRCAHQLRSLLLASGEASREVTANDRLCDGAIVIGPQATVESAQSAYGGACSVQVNLGAILLRCGALTYVFAGPTRMLSRVDFHGERS